MVLIGCDYCQTGTRGRLRNISDESLKRLMVVNLYEFDFWVGVSLYFEVEEPNACTKSKLYGNVSLPVTSTSP